MLNLVLVKLFVQNKYLQSNQIYASTKDLQTICSNFRYIWINYVHGDEQQITDTVLACLEKHRREIPAETNALTQNLELVRHYPGQGKVTVNERSVVLVEGMATAAELQLYEQSSAYCVILLNKQTKALRHIQERYAKIYYSDDASIPQIQDVVIANALRPIQLNIGDNAKGLQDVTSSFLRTAKVVHALQRQSIGAVKQLGPLELALAIQAVRERWLIRLGAGVEVPLVPALRFMQNLYVPRMVREGLQEDILYYASEKFDVA